MEHFKVEFYACAHFGILFNILTHWLATPGIVCLFLVVLHVDPGGGAVWLAVFAHHEPFQFVVELQVAVRVFKCELPVLVESIREYLFVQLSFSTDQTIFIYFHSFGYLIQFELIIYASICVFRGHAIWIRFSICFSEFFEGCIIAVLDRFA